MLKRGMYRMYKRADLPLPILLIFELFLAAVFVLVLFNFVRYFENQNFYEADYLAKDSALLIDSLNAAPANVFYSYSNLLLPVDKFAITIDREKSEIKFDGAGYKFAQNAIYPAKLAIPARAAYVNFAKEGFPMRNLALTELANLYAIPCPAGAFALAGKKILLEPKDSAARAVANQLVTNEMFALAGKITEAQAGAIAIIRSTQSGVIKAYYNDAEGSKKLACEILNSLSATQGVKGAALVPIIPEYLKPSDDRAALLTQKPAVLLDMGSMKESEAIAAINHGAQAALG